MRQVYRLCRPQYAPGLDGLGARRVGGRWNSPGRGAVYCAGSIALATLETFVHLPPSMRAAEKLPNLSLVVVLVPDGLPGRLVEADDLPEGSDISISRALGDDWIDRGETLWLDVPSLVIPWERNLILNPAHPAMADVRVEKVLPFRFDPRLGK